jgi:hypothetical protein
VLECCFDQHHKIVRMVTMMEMYHTLLKQHNCNLNMCDLDKIGLSRYDHGQDMSQMTKLDKGVH